MAARQRLEKYLREEGVQFETMSHPVAYTAQEVAAAQHTPGSQLAKVAMVDADGEMLMLVLPGSYRIDFPKLRAALESKKVRLAKEEEFAGVFTDCEVGAMPPFGNLYEVPVYVDASLSKVTDMVFKAGSHNTSFKMKYADYERLAKPEVIDFALHL
jgi:Ala-tRNA(Pro) deacylase